MRFEWGDPSHQTKPTVISYTTNRFRHANGSVSLVSQLERLSKLEDRLK